MVTIRDVAKQAGVSMATVSNVFTENRGVNEETRRKVLHIAKELNYTPNLIASSMVTKKTNIIGVFFYNFTQKNFLAYSEFLKGVTQKCQTNGQRVLVYVDITEKQLHEGFLMGHEPIDAAMLFFPQEDEFRTKDLKNVRIPFVFVGKCEGFHFIDCENTALTYQLTCKLVEAGHKEICFFNSNEKWALTHDRRAGFIKALADGGVPQEWCKEYNGNYENGESVVEQAFADGFRAFVAENPRMVQEIYKTAARKGMQIGKDVSVVCLGYDTQFDYMCPAVTCAKLSYEKLGERALELVEEIKTSNTSRAVYLNAEISEGASVAKIN